MKPTYFHPDAESEMIDARHGMKPNKRVSANVFSLPFKTPSTE